MLFSRLMLPLVLLIIGGVVVGVGAFAMSQDPRVSDMDVVVASESALPRNSPPAPTTVPPSTTTTVVAPLMTTTSTIPPSTTTTTTTSSPRRAATTTTSFLPATTTTTSPPLATTTTTAPQTGSFNSAYESQFRSLINGFRSTPLLSDSSLNSYARSWSRHMAESGNFGHSNIQSLLPPWSTVAENIAYGSSVPSMFDALKASSGHRSNMVNESFTHVGVGVWVDADGTVWTTHVFAG